MRGDVEDCDHMEGELATASANRQVAIGAIITTLEHLKRHSSNARATEAAVLSVWN